MTNQARTIPSELQFAVDKMSTAGYKLTSPRMAVLQAAATFPGAFSAAQLAERLNQHGHCTDVGVMQRIHGFSECHRYILSPHAHAHRVVCTECGSVAEFDECGLDQLILTLEQQTGFTVSEHLLELFGQCPPCQHHSL